MNTQQQFDSAFKQVFDPAKPSGKTIWLDLGVAGDSVECVVKTTARGDELVSLHAKTTQTIFWPATGERHIKTIWVDLGPLVDDEVIFNELKEQAA